jgi:hypothetical protein
MPEAGGIARRIAAPGIIRYLWIAIVVYGKVLSITGVVIALAMFRILPENFSFWEINNNPLFFEINIWHSPDGDSAEIRNYS